jgi:hypothetical protein
VTYSTHVIVLTFVISLLSVAPPHPINELIVNDKNSMVNLRQDISSHLLQEVYGQLGSQCFKNQF